MSVSRSKETPSTVREDVHLSPAGDDESDLFNDIIPDRHLVGWLWFVSKHADSHRKSSTRWCLAELSPDHLFYLLRWGYNDEMVLGK